MEECQRGKRHLYGLRDGNMPNDEAVAEWFMRVEIMVSAHNHSYQGRLALEDACIEEFKLSYKVSLFVDLREVTIL